MTLRGSSGRPIATSVIIQDPSDLSAGHLLESMLAACEGAKRGAGAFAWATSRGARLLLTDEAFTRFVRANEFDLIVGIDLTTSTDTVKTITELGATLPGLRVRIFLHDRAASLFHPKFCWFRGQRGGTVIAGSGNLTTAGLLTNWEAFALLQVDEKTIRQIEAQWEAWTSRQAACLLEVSDERVIARAAINTERFRVGIASGKSVGRVIIEEDEVLTPPQSQDPVLVAELPRSDNRWNQANFSQRVYVNFFGAMLGSQRRIILQEVRPDGDLGELENRPSVEVKSMNYRFELAAARGRNYPDAGRPIAVFVRLPDGIFLYQLLMPGGAGYENASAFLHKHYNGPKRHARRVESSVGALKAAWPEAALWKLTPNAPEK